MKPYVIIGTSKCLYCDKVKSLLVDRYSDYEYHDIDKSPWLRVMFRMTPMTTVPQVFSPEGLHVGGYTDLKAHLEAQKYD